MALPTVIEPMAASLQIGSYTFCAVSLGAVGVTGGDAIETTTLCNTEWVTKMAQTLKEVPDIPFTSFYDPTDFDTITALVNVNSECVLTIPSVGTITFFAFLQNWEPQEAGRGEGWQVTGVITVTNVDPSDNSESGPVWAPAV